MSWYAASRNCGKIGEVSPGPSRPCPPRAANRWPKAHQSFDTSTWELRARRWGGGGGRGLDKQTGRHFVSIQALMKAAKSRFEVVYYSGVFWGAFRGSCLTEKLSRDWRKRETPRADGAECDSFTLCHRALKGGYAFDTVGRRQRPLIVATYSTSSK